MKKYCAALMLACGCLAGQTVPPAPPAPLTLAQTVEAALRAPPLVPGITPDTPAPGDFAI